MKKIFNRYNLSFTTEIDEIVRKIADEKDWTLTKVFEKSVKFFDEYYDRAQNLKKQFDKSDD